MSTIGKIFGRSPFNQLQLHMEQVIKCVSKMNEALDQVQTGNFEKLDAFANEVSQLEHQADQIKDDLRNRMIKRFFMPIDKSDVLEILSLQDELADTAEDVCVILTMKQLKVPDDIRESFNSFRRLNLDAVEKVAEMVSEIDELVESGFGGAEAEKVRAMAHDVAYAEHQADQIQHKLLRAIYSKDAEMSIGEFHLWMRLTGVMAELSNIAENLADRILKTLSLK